MSNNAAVNNEVFMFRSRMERVAFSAYGSKGLSGEETGSGEPQYVTIASPDSGITSQEMASPRGFEPLLSP
jgi:hypothetical protein